MPLRVITDAGYAAGMVRDTSSWLLPAGAVYDSLNMLYDQPGVARQRGGTTALVSGSQTAFCTSIGFCYSQDATTIEELYGVDGKTGNAYSINKSTGAATNIGTPLAANSTVGRPVRHFGFLVFPGGTSTAAVMAGQTSSTTFTSAAASTVTAANPVIALSGGDTTTNIKVGAYVLGIGAAYAYAGRVVSINSGSTFSVWPVPTQTFSVGAGSLTALPTGASGNHNGGVCATSFQNRLLFANTYDMAAEQTSSTISKADRRINYGVLPTETGSRGSLTYTGAAGFLFSASWPVLNYVDVPGADPIVALEPIDSNRLLILTTTDVMILSGNLTTYLGTTSPSITYDIYPFDVTSGCLSDLSVMRTPAGIMWAGAEGIFAYWPPIRRSLAHTGMRNLLDGKMLNYWLNLVNTPPFVIHGAAYARNHYYISGTAGGATWSLCCNLSSNPWTRFSGAGTDIFNGVRRPSNPQQTFVARWWDQTGAAPSMTNGQVVRADSMFAPYVTGATKTDSDGAAVPVSLTTRVITGDAETNKIFQRGTFKYAQDATSSVVSVTGQSKIDAADIQASSIRSFGNLPSTATRTITGATNATPIVITTSAAHGLQTEFYVDIDGVTGNLNANGRWRITTGGGSTFTLVGSSGSGAYAGGGQVKALTDQDFQINTLNAGQGASFTVSGSPNNFEMHGVELTVLERTQ